MRTGLHAFTASDRFPFRRKRAKTQKAATREACGLCGAAVRLSFAPLLCPFPLPFRPRAIDGYFRYKPTPASKHGTASLLAWIVCALQRSAQWHVQQAQRQRACAASLC
jgi:hypothetical protein